VLVEAGPGTGKTRVLTARMAWLIAQGCKPHDILAITFTNKAANEMAERLGAAGLSGQLQITTYHSWAFNFLKDRVPDRACPVVVTENEQKRILTEVARSEGFDGKIKAIFDRIQFLKQSYPIKIEEEPEDVQLLWKLYHDRLSAYNLYDYDDLIIAAIDHLESQGNKDENVLSYYHVLIDEFQDVSPAQYKLTQLIASHGCRVMAIGDPNQSIYGFRGSDPVFMRRFETDFSPCTRISLTSAYRCPQRLLDAARIVLAVEEAPVLKSHKGHAGNITFKKFQTPEKEAGWVARKIDQLSGGISFESLNQGIASGQGLRSLSDIAILFRINRIGQIFAKELEKAGIPYQFGGAANPLSDEKLNKLWHLLEFIEGRDIDYHLFMLRPEERKRLLSLTSNLKKEMKAMEPSNLLKTVSRLLKFQYSTSEARLLKKAIKWHQRGRPLSLALKAEQDVLDFHVEAVSLLSLHASKGLEFPVVFITGCEQGLIPWEKGDIQEERRLLYVGLTRASEQVFITCSMRRHLYGEKIETQPSPFLEDIDELISKEKGHRKRRKKARQKKLF